MGKSGELASQASLGEVQGKTPIPEISDLCQHPHCAEACRACLLFSTRKFSSQFNFIPPLRTPDFPLPFPGS